MEQSKAAANLAYIEQVLPNVRYSIKFSTSDNFTGRKVPGYETVPLLSYECIDALAIAQQQINKLGFDLVVYDYQPKCPIKLVPDPVLANLYYPHLSATQLDRFFDFKRANTVAVSCIRKDKDLYQPVWSQRIFNRKTLPFYSDGSIDFYTSFGILDSACQLESTDVPSIMRNKRQLVVHAMQNAGFENHNNHWWYFTLRN